MPSFANESRFGDLVLLPNEPKRLQPHLTAAISVTG